MTHPPTQAGTLDRFVVVPASYVFFLRPIDERIDFFFTCRSWSGEHRIVEPTKAAALEWFGLDALPDPVVPHELTVLQGLTNGIAPYSTFGF